MPSVECGAFSYSKAAGTCELFDSAACSTSTSPGWNWTTYWLAAGGACPATLGGAGAVGSIIGRGGSSSRVGGANVTIAASTTAAALRIAGRGHSAGSIGGGGGGGGSTIRRGASAAVCSLQPAGVCGGGATVGRISNSTANRCCDIATDAAAAAFTFDTTTLVCTLQDAGGPTTHDPACQSGTTGTATSTSCLEAQFSHVSQLHIPPTHTHTHARARCDVFYFCACSHWVLTGACTPMVCPIHAYRQRPGTATVSAAGPADPAALETGQLFGRWDALWPAPCGQVCAVRQFRHYLGLVIFFILFVTGLAWFHVFLSSTPPHTRCEMQCTLSSTTPHTRCEMQCTLSSTPPHTAVRCSVQYTLFYVGAENRVLWLCAVAVCCGRVLWPCAVAVLMGACDLMV